MIGYSDNSPASNRNDGKETTRTIFYFSGNPITWCSQKQWMVALFTCELEFMVATSAACQKWVLGEKKY